MRFFYKLQPFENMRLRIRRVNINRKIRRLGKHLNHLQRLYIRVQPLKASFVRAQNIAAAWNHCHPWQFWLNNLFIPRDIKK